MVTCFVFNHTAVDYWGSAGNRAVGSWVWPRRLWRKQCVDFVKIHPNFDDVLSTLVTWWHIVRLQTQHCLCGCALVASTSRHDRCVACLTWRQSLLVSWVRCRHTRGGGWGHAPLTLIRETLSFQRPPRSSWATPLHQYKTTKQTPLSPFPPTPHSLRSLLLGVTRPHPSRYRASYSPPSPSSSQCTRG